MAFYINNNQNVFLQFDLLKKHTNVKHFITTRIDGDQNRFNPGFADWKNPEEVISNRKKLAESFAITPQNMVFCRQTHSDNVEVFDQQIGGNGFFSRDNAISDTDAVITNVKGICPVIMTADCVPILLYDTRNKAIGTVHSGWRGTQKLFLKKVMSRMSEVYNTKAENLLCCIGPSAGPCCYEVGDEVVALFNETFGGNQRIIIRNGLDKAKLDLWHANEIQALDFGLPSENIEISKNCSMCEHETFYSARIHKADVGRIGSGIFLV